MRIPIISVIAVGIACGASAAPVSFNETPFDAPDRLKLGNKSPSQVLLQQRDLTRELDSGFQEVKNLSNLEPEKNLAETFDASGLSTQQFSKIKWEDPYTRIFRELNDPKFDIRTMNPTDTRGRSRSGSQPKMIKSMSLSEKDFMRKGMDDLPYRVMNPGTAESKLKKSNSLPLPRDMPKENTFKKPVGPVEPAKAAKRTLLNKLRSQLRKWWSGSA